ncbi:MAG: helix-turn-helix domain-containing protein [Gordonia sp. (in: high G+C Gram-positive bacteria)]|uniref:sigma-54-dependent Fis family transcriptional regulator n=1 Tax=Gordonia sp. (in: high G+C Gram-positive bacteria) TaxID=84139 RepID=UPI0039E3360D
MPTRTPAPPGDQRELTPEIESSWRRSRLYGLTREEPPRLAMTKPGCRVSLQRTAAPIMDRMYEEFRGAPMTMTLADTEGRVLDFRPTNDSVRAALESLGLESGVSLAEDVIGTNSIGTILETRAPMMIYGPEHFSHAFTGFTCFGSPVIHPVTHRLEGVLNVGGCADQDDRYFEPIARRLVHDIEQQLLINSPAAQQELLAAFHTASRGNANPVMVLGEGLTLASPAALEVLDPVAHAALRATAEGSPPDGEQTLLLASGERLLFACHPVAGSSGVLIELLSCSRRGQPTTAQIRAQATWPLLICGETGTGRTSEARRIAGPGHRLLDAADVVRYGERHWVELADTELRENDGVLIIENVDLLNDSVATVLSRMLGTTRRRVVLTATGDPQRLPAGLRSVCNAQRELPPLRRNRQDIPGLASRLLAEESGGAPVRFTPEALRILAGGTWPGNLAELRRVIREAARTRSVGDITPTDLPEAYRSVGAPLTPFQVAEREVIVSAIDAAGGNKLKAAQALGVSRSTLYNRMRTLKIH